jgi:hypothetical protein
MPPVVPTNQNQTERIPLAIGLTLGLLALVIGALGSVWYLRRRRRMTVVDLAESPVPPYTVRQAIQPASFPQLGKRPPQPALPSGTASSTASPSIFSPVTTESGLGPPPSYENPMHHQRVDPAQ